MDKKTFLKELKCALKKLKKDECNKYIAYYDEMISDVMESGCTEEEAVKRQGSIAQIAADILAESEAGQRKPKDWCGICLVVVSALLLVSCILRLLLQIQFGMQMSSAIGIIGGADGPTSIFVAGKIGTPWGLYLITALVLAAAVGYFVKRKK